MVESPPELSVVVVVPEGVRGASERWQSVLEAPALGIELLFVQAGVASAPASRGARFVAAPAGATVPRLRALGLQAARGGIVAFGEAFLRPVPGWAGALLAAHRGTPAVAVAGSFTRDSGSARDWALTLVEYGRLFAARRAPERSDASFANVSFKREPLLRLLSGASEEVVEPEVHSRLRAAGQPFAYCGGARVVDENEQPLGRSFSALYHHGRFYGARRVAHGTRGERLLHFALCPLVPVIQLARVTRAASAARILWPLLRALPALVLLLFAWALGEAVGSLRGEGASGRRWR